MRAIWATVAWLPLAVVYGRRDCRRPGILWAGRWRPRLKNSRLWGPSASGLESRYLLEYPPAIFPSLLSTEPNQASRRVDSIVADGYWVISKRGERVGVVPATSIEEAIPLLPPTVPEQQA
jgi:hypothetical protein